MLKVERISTTVRGLAASDGKYYLGGANGYYGIYHQDSLQSTFFPQYRNLDFRSLTIADKRPILLSAGSPAILLDVADPRQPKPIYRDFSESIFYDGLEIDDSGLGIAFGDPISGCFSFLRSWDGGMNWHTISCDNLPKPNEGEAGFAASNSSLKLINDTIFVATGGGGSRFLKSLDGGESWSVTDLPLEHTNQMSGAFSMDFFNSNLGVVAGGNWDDKEASGANLIITRNGGKTWQRIDNSLGYISKIMFVPDSNGQKLITVSSRLIGYSEDQGKTWQKVPIEGFYTVDMKDSANGMFAGKNKIAMFKLE